MAIIFVTIAFLLCWLWLEISLFFFKKNASELDNIEGISYNKFVWILRVLVIVLFIGLVIYMNFFENIKLQEAIKYCLGIIK